MVNWDRERAVMACFELLSHYCPQESTEARKFRELDASRLQLGQTYRLS
jgi:hypothetical protein